MLSDDIAPGGVECKMRSQAAMGTELRASTWLKSTIRERGTICMSRPTFAERGSTAEIEHGMAFAPKLDASGLLPAVVTDAGDGTVLMLAWMNAEALGLTVETRVAHFWSRSRNRLWKKGEESGNTLEVVDMRTDCDQDAIWLSVRVKGAGVACHTGARTCFYRRIGPSGTLAPTPDAKDHEP